MCVPCRISMLNKMMFPKLLKLSAQCDLFLSALENKTNIQLELLHNIRTSP